MIFVMGPEVQKGMLFWSSNIYCMSTERKRHQVLNNKTLNTKHVTTRLLTGQNEEKILFGIDQNHSFLYIMQYGLHVFCDNNQ